jgi:hypothetical protein
LNCGFVRERGIERTSTSRSTDTCRSKATNSSIERVEWPIVKIVGMAWDCRTEFLRPYASSQAYERENEDQARTIKPRTFAVVHARSEVVGP